MCACVLACRPLLRRAVAPALGPRDRAIKRWADKGRGDVVAARRFPQRRGKVVQVRQQRACAFAVPGLLDQRLKSGWQTCRAHRWCQISRCGVKTLDFEVHGAKLAKKNEIKKKSNRLSWDGQIQADKAQ